MKLALKKLLQAHPSMQVSTLLSGSLTTPSAKQEFIPPNSFESIATATGGGTSITLSSIPATYTHLQVRINYARNTGSATLNMKINGSSSSINTMMYLYAVNTTVSTYFDTANSEMSAVGVAYNGPTSRGSGVIEILNYANTSMWKTTRTFYGSIGSNSQTVYHTGLWASTDAITSLVFNISGDTFSSDTQIALYGIKGV